MYIWTIESCGTAREIYRVKAETEEEARELFSRGEIEGPFFTEVNNCEIVEIAISGEERDD